MCPNCGSGIVYIKDEQATTTQPAAKPPIKKKSSNPSSDIVAVDHVILEDYLQTHHSRKTMINIRYQSQRQNSANKWRLLNVISFDNTYIAVEGYDGTPYRYRRDRVVEIR